MDKYLEELEKYCADKNIDSTPIIEKIKSRFELGKEAGLTEEEIIERLGDYSDYVCDNSKELPLKFSESSAEYDYKSLEIHLVGNVDLKVCDSDDDKIHVNMDEELEDIYELLVENDKIILHSKNHHGCFNNIDGDIELFLPNNLTYQSVNIEDVNGDIDCDDYGFVCQNCHIETVNGDLSFAYIKSDSCKISTVSGDIDIDNLFSEKTQIDSVNGDVEVSKGKTNTLDVSSVNGDINFNGIVDIVNSSTVNGDITVNKKIVSQTISDAINNAFKTFKSKINK
ncbi:MAG: DUF4097 family beta strand repeat-containing protein [Erysipelotrichia bacterium]|nr:DUF4097 family beta strand repeat-containing protein [Erysipelotrichia bacterium]